MQQSKSNLEPNVIRGYKVFTPEFKAKQGDFQYAENTEYVYGGPIKICSSGFHFCIKASHCFSYYNFSPENIVCEVEARGVIDTHNEDSKVCTNILYVGRRLSWAEVLTVANDGKDNTGHSNSGDRNSGNWNSGNWNSGDSNSGYSNSGNWNSGNSNSGDSNSGYRNSGAFCTDNNPYLILFNKPTKIKIKDWENHKAVEIMYRLKPTIWIPSSIMNDKEKEANPKYETTEGYLKTISMKEAWANLWGNLSDENKKVFTDLPGFDATIFEEITGIKTN